MPGIDELTLEEPEIVRQGGQYGVRLSASAPSLHIMRANIHTELSPTVGSEQQGEELIKSLLADFETDPGKLWSTNIFGKSLNELVSEACRQSCCTCRRRHAAACSRRLSASSTRAATG